MEETAFDPAGARNAPVKESDKPPATQASESRRLEEEGGLVVLISLEYLPDIHLVEILIGIIVGDQCSINKAALHKRRMIQLAADQRQLCLLKTNGFIHKYGG